MAWDPDDIALVESLSGGGGEERRKWRCLVRNGRMLLLIRVGAPRDVLRLYQPQRAFARCVHTFLKLTYSLGGFLLLRRMDGRVSEGSPMSTIEKKTAMEVQAILLGNADQDGRRAIMFLAGSEGAAMVAKVGVDPIAREVVTREYEFINRWSKDFPAMQPCDACWEGDGWSAFMMNFLGGKNVGVEDEVELLGVLQEWAAPKQAEPLCHFQQWDEVCRGWPYPDRLPELQNAGARVALIPALSHRDMAPWNVIRNKRGEIMVIDWERGMTAGIPGWDWVHFLYQTATLIDRKPAERTAEFLQDMLSSQASQAYLDAVGWSGEETWLLCTYLAARQPSDPVLRQNVLACLLGKG